MFPLSCCGLRKTFGKDAGLVRAVDGVDLDVAAGETVAIMGPSGCGKSTLLHLLGGLDRPSGGEVRLAGSRVDRDLHRLCRSSCHGCCVQRLPHDVRCQRCAG